MNVYALKNYNSTKSSSGGAFPAIVEAYREYCGSDNLVVYGAAFVEGFDVRHIRVAYTDGLDALKESKYVHSKTTGVYNSVQKDLSEGIHVVFVGMPCQVAGLNAFLKRCGTERKNLLTIDLICRGTPKNEFWIKYVEYVKRRVKGDIKEIHFRYKHGINDSKDNRAIVMGDGTVHISPKELRPYMSMFFRNLLFPEMCFNCPHRNKELTRPGDFTIGDFWGVEEVIPRFKNIDGVSLVLSNNETSDNIVSNNLTGKEGLLLERCEGTKWLELSTHLNIQNFKPKTYDTFWAEYKTCDFDVFVDKWGKEPFKRRVKAFLKKVAKKLV